jgi:ABC-2 type transport system permease protein
MWMRRWLEKGSKTSPAGWIASVARLAMRLSILFRSPATAVLVTLGIWLFLTILWPMLAPALAPVIAPQDPRYAALGLDTPETAAWTQALSRLSPNDLFGETMLAMSPSTRALGAQCFSSNCVAR